jgi:hypothetical protein
MRNTTEPYKRILFGMKKRCAYNLLKFLNYSYISRSIILNCSNTRHGYINSTDNLARTRKECIQSSQLAVTSASGLIYIQAIMVHHPRNSSNILIPAFLSLHFKLWIHATNSKSMSK